ncbi:hypothetical protein SRABI106_03533 [Rahnella aquatilis]|nr:hypothetical protein SRABI106_03533 [Rahnella aquatilis]
MAFFFTMPINRITPISAIRLNSVPAKISDSNAPTAADGSVERMVTGWIKLSYRIPSTTYMVSSAARISHSVLPVALSNDAAAP